MEHKKTNNPRRRIRPTLLVLLWVWALCVFTVVDLFWNVPEFDTVRPRSVAYQSMRYAAHDLVGEPYRDGESREEHPGWRLATGAATSRPESVDPGPALAQTVRDGSASLESRVAACRAMGKAQATWDLKATALDTGAPATVRIAAVEELERIDGGDAYAALRAVSGVTSRVVARRAWLARARAEQRSRERAGAARTRQSSGR